MSETSAGTGAGTGSGPGASAGSTDFPGFVADLLRGVYDSIVTASVMQMDAYLKLVKKVADSVDEYLDDVAKAGGECLEGLCSARAWAHTSPAPGARQKTGDTTAEAAPGGES
ncbi:MAG TPA: hypothetical protein VF771_03190 [Longimicrobiaceae bacterium]